MTTPDTERAHAYTSVKQIFDEQPPLRIANRALLRMGYSHNQTFDLMQQHFNLGFDPRSEYLRNVKLYNLRDLEGHKS